ncbi:MAG: F0F1 ATP synthase subunit gamma, partial [Burkholderiaceae bacterium]|nr:F0F1 ATP synthase subunit gamma [Burkholderiaceae bacterium]
DKIRNIAAHLAQANPEYRHPFLVAREDVRAASLIVVTTDKGLCGGMNTNVLRAVTAKLKELQDAGAEVQSTAIGNKGFGFLNRIGVQVASHIVQLGDTPHLERLIGPVKVQLDAYAAGEVDRVFIAYTRFVNTMAQEPVVEQLLPLPAERMQEDSRAFAWDFIYEPDAQSVLEELLVRYVEALVFQAVAENMASEQSARMVAMKAASDNAKEVIEELQLSYNKARQASITKELAEIVGGAAAV